MADRCGMRPVLRHALYSSERGWNETRPIGRRQVVAAFGGRGDKRHERGRGDVQELKRLDPGAMELRQWTNLDAIGEGELGRLEDQRVCPTNWVALGHLKPTTGSLK